MLYLCPTMNANVSSLDFPVKTVAPTLAQRKFNQWILKRIENVPSHDVDEDPTMPTVPNVQTLSGFLQTIGFELLSFGKRGSLSKEDMKSVITVTIECGTSGTKAVLELKELECQCTDSELRKNNRDNNEALRNFENITQNGTYWNTLRAGSQTEKPEIGVKRSHTQPEMRLRVDQKTWDMNGGNTSPDEEPRPWPPKMTSSPAVIDLSASFGQISLDNDTESPRNVIQYIVGAQKNLENALKMLSAKKSSISSDLSSNREHDVESVKSAPANISPENGIRISNSSGSNMTRSMKDPAKLNHEKSVVTKSKNIQSPKARRNIEPTLTKSHTRRSLQIELGSMCRYNFGSLTSTSNNTSVASKPVNTDSPLKTTGSTESNSGKMKLVSGCDLPNNKTFSTLKKPSEQGGVPSPINNTPNTRTRSLLKPPTKISIAKSVSKLKPSATINTGLATRRSMPSRE